MKLRRVVINLRKKQLELETRSGRVLPFPFVKMEPRPTVKDPIVELFIDPELANEAAVYFLRSGKEGVVHVDYALDYNCDPAYLAMLAMHQLSVQAGERVKEVGLSHREIARRLGTSAAQVHRLLDTANYSKSMKQLLALLQVLDCEVRIVVHPRAKHRKTRTGQRAAA